MKHLRFIIFPIIWICLLLPSCIEQLNVDILDRSQLLVVEGVISDQEGPYQVALTWSSTLDSAFFLPVEGAEVMLEEGSELKDFKVDPKIRKLVVRKSRRSANK